MRHARATLALLCLSLAACVSDFAEPGDEQPPPGGELCADTPSFRALAPNPYAADGSGSFIAASTAFSAAFSATVHNAGPTNFKVRGLQSGEKFRGQSYTGNGSRTISTPLATLLPGEEVELVITTALTCPDPWVGRLRVAPTVSASGMFPSFNTFDAGENSFAVAVADLNRDGNLDIAVANIGQSGAPSAVSVLLGNGTGAFPVQQTYAVGVSPSSVAIGDLDQDGQLDLAVANAGNDTIRGSISVLLGNGNGTFQSQQMWPAGENPSSVAIGDLNGDGFTDMVAANPTDPAGVTVLLSDGFGDFQDAGFFQTGGVGAVSVAIADLNADGALDVATANPNSNNVGVQLGNGDGTFRSGRTFAVGSQPRTVAMGDFNRDGDLDLAVANSGSNTVSLLIGNGTGAFPTVQTQTVGDSVQSVAVGDLNADGRLDLAALTLQPIGAAVLLNSASGFLPQQSFGIGTRMPRAVTIGDVNRDGRLDLIVARMGASGLLDNVSILLGQ